MEIGRHKKDDEAEGEEGEGEVEGIFSLSAPYRKEFIGSQMLRQFCSVVCCCASRAHRQ